jgi:hypothetical protein
MVDKDTPAEASAQATPTPRKATPPAPDTTTTATEKQLENVRLVLSGLPNMTEFTTSGGLVIDRQGVVVPASEVEALKAEAAKYGVVILEEEVA